MTAGEAAVAGSPGQQPRHTLVLLPSPEAGEDGLRFSLFGTIRAWRGEVELNVGPPQQRAILALLLVRANRLVSVGDMIELVWGQDPPGSAVNAIHKYIGCIRRLLEPGLGARANGQWLTRHGDAYRLRVDEGMTDLVTFRRLAEEARSARAKGRPADAWALLGEALALRRGACGESLDLRGQNQDHFTAVDQEYFAAVAEAAESALASGQAPQILPVLRQAAADEPLNETLQAHLMMVLAATGQQARALSHYQLVRQQLSEELGVDPGAELCSAHGKVLQQKYPVAARLDGALADITDPGHTLDAQVDIQAPGFLVPLVPPAQLPADLQAFAGRESELSFLSEIHEAAAQSPCTVVICAIDGMPGVGKSAAAVRWAHQVADRFADGQLFVDLRGFDSGGRPTSPSEALRLLLTSLGTPQDRIPDSLDARAAMYRSILSGKRVLVVLDNARDAEQVRPLLPGSPGCLVLATSRNPLSGLVMTHGARLLTLEPPSRREAWDILQRRLGRARIAAEPAAVEEIIRLCDRLPLALACVSVRAVARPAFPLAAIAEELRRTPGRLDMLAASGGAADPREAFFWSYRYLSPQARRLFRAVPSRPAAVITCPIAARLLGIRLEEALRLITELTNVSLLAEYQPGCYRPHVLVQAYAAELSEGTEGEPGPRTVRYSHIESAAS
jgi:DNA-binding SARP family transcriptional activator